MASTKRKREESAPGWAWMLFGLSIGLAVALVVYLQSGRPAADLGADQAPARSFEQERIDQAPPAGPPAASASESSAAAGHGPERSGATAYSFYDDLSKSVVVVEGDEFDFGSADAPRVVLIQAGAFRKIEEADSRQAELGLLGYESHIDSAIVNGSLWFRVLIGPLTERAERNRIERRLRSEGIETAIRTVAN